MEKQDAKHMKYGKYVKNTLTGEIYQLIENMSTEKETVKVVNKRNLERYDTLTAWIRNWETNNMGFRDRFTEDIEECKTEKLTYEKEQKIADVMPHNKIPFITCVQRQKMSNKAGQFEQD